MHEQILEGNLIEEYMLGNSKIKIFDSAYINRTPEEIERTLQNIREIAIRHYQREATREDENST